ncbi:SCP2 sterol-binding domain-containing protein [Marinospirillum sp.]|uniref:SCP2 sterol-binding domain-containing protein n=1 Tax=Marinospirillum sp. TaxID=2183934 RepID=UPI00287013AA|nr:SCP2 sterol-binding domain-containing protein [Marinospirillum sp.]MDR9466784.1 SCP2 sterol-binding domain-containing protein [Marinospirillum sp.]
MLRLKFLLWMLGRLLKKAYKAQPEMREKLEKEPLNFVIKTQDWQGRSFQLQPQQVSSQAGDLEQADMKLIFQSAQDAWKTLTSKDKNAFIRAIQDGEVKIEGDPKKLFQLQGLMKYLKV